MGRTKDACWNDFNEPFAKEGLTLEKLGMVHDSTDYRRFWIGVRIWRRKLLLNVATVKKRRSWTQKRRVMEFIKMNKN